MESARNDLVPLPFDITAEDGFTLSASIFGASDRIIILHSAVGVPKYFYGKFARYLAGHGFTVITYDYRGIGGSRPKSLRSFQPRYQDWGALDARAVIRWANESLKPRTVISICHSGGAQVLGLVPEIEGHGGVVTIASPSGAWRHWPAPRRYQVRMLSLLLPLVAMTIGYIPLRWLRLGEDIPGAVAWEWSRWSGDPEFLLGRRFGLDTSGFARYKGPLLAISIEDDSFAPRQAVDALTRMYSAARVESIHIRPEELSVEEVGHFGFFKDRFKDTAWRDIIRWLERVVR